MCRLDGVPQRETKAEALKAVEMMVCGGIESFPSIARAKARAKAIRAEDPEGWAEAHKCRSL